MVLNNPLSLINDNRNRRVLYLLQDELLGIITKELFIDRSGLFNSHNLFTPLFHNKFIYD